MIADAIKTTLTDLWASTYATAVHYLTLQFVEPIWWWVGAYAVFVFVVWAICWFFGTYWPTVRVVGGFFLLAATLGIAGMWKGRNDIRAFDAKRKPRRRP